MKTTKRILVLLCLMVVTMGAWADPAWKIRQGTTGDWADMTIQEPDPSASFDAQAAYTTKVLPAGTYTYYVKYFADSSSETPTAQITDKGGGLTFTLTSPSTIYFVCKHPKDKKYLNTVCNTKSFIICDSGWETLTFCSPSPASKTNIAFFNAYGDFTTDANKIKAIDGSGIANTSTTHTGLASGSDYSSAFIRSGSISTGVNKVTVNYEDATLTFEPVTTLPVTIGEAGASTLVLPAQAAIPAGVKAYTLKYENSVLKATGLTSIIPANTPVLLNANPGTYDFDMGENAVEYNKASETISSKSKSYIKDVNRDGNFIDADNVLVGVMQPHYVPTNSYVLQDGKNGLGFYNVGETANYRINQFRCYVTLPGAGARSLSIVFDDEETTGIADVKGQKEDVRSDIFNLSGQRVGKDYKGVVIKNGRKMIQK